MYLGKKKIKELNRISVHDKVLKDYGFNFHDNNPELWTNEDKIFYDVIVNIEMKMIEEMNNIISSEQN
jgi:hypothetical protein